MTSQKRPNPPPEGETVLQLLRSNMTLLREIATRYEVNFQPDRPEEMPSIHCPQDVYNLLAPEMAHLAQEQVRVLLLDTRNNVMAQRVIYQGNLNSSVIRPAEVLRPAIIESAANIIVSHNHPAGDPTPSPEDVTITRDLVQAGNLMGIELLDHIIIGRNRWCSLKEQQMMG